MATSRSGFSLALCCLLSTSLLAGCDTSDIVNQYPALSPIIGPRPKARPFTLGRGHITGVVVSTEGTTLANAFVTTGGAYTFSAELPSTEEELAVLPYVPNENNNRDRVYVENGLFINEEGVEEEGPAFRIIRKFPPTNNFQDKYYFLRNGEFLLEGIPEGEALVTASFDDVVGAAQRFTIFPNFLLRDTRFTLDIPEPLPTDASGRAPAIVDWSGIEPPTGITVKVLVRQTLDALQQAQTETTVTYEPESANVLVSLRSPPGSAGSFISGYTLKYTTGARLPDNSNFDDGSPEITVPLPPTLIPPGQPKSNGPTVTLEIPIGSITLQKIFERLEELKVTPPPIINARIGFLDRAGQRVKGGIVNNSLIDLVVTVPLRALSQ